MAATTITSTRFPSGTEVGAYPVSNWPSPAPPSGAPSGAATATATVVNGEATFTGLTQGAEFWAVAAVSGTYRYVRFSAGEDLSDSAENLHVSDIGSAGEVGKVLAADDRVVLDAKARGCKGDGASDDAPAINAAITALNAEGGGVLYFPAGTYVVKSNLLLKSKVIIAGAGIGLTAIKAAAGVTTAPLYATAGNAVEDVLVRDLTVDGNYAAFAGNVYGIFLSEAKRVRITNVRVKDTYHIGVFGSKCTELLIDKCKLDNVASMSAASPNAIHISEGVRIRVLDNVVTDWGRNKEGHAIYCTASHGAQITGNNVSNPGGIDHLHMIAIVSSNRCIISDNQLDDTGYLGSSLTTIGISVVHSNDVVVLGNRIFQPSQNNGSREAIQIDGTSARASVTGNHCEGGNDNGITLWGLGEHACVGNFVTGASNAGISVNSNNNVVTGNTCKNTGHNTPVPKPAGIAIENPRTGNVIVGNRCYDDQEVKTQTYGIWEINGAGGNMVSGNDVTGNLTAGLLVTSATTVVGPNQGATPRGGEVEIRDIGAEAFGDGRHPVTPVTGTMQLRSDAAQVGVRTGAASYTPLEKARNATLIDGATVTPSFANGNHFILSAGGSRTIENVSFRQAGSVITFDIKNDTAGAIVTTWNAGYHLAGAWVDPAAGKCRTITFYYDGAVWKELGRSPGDITP